MTYDDGHLYVAFMCYDEPGLVRASLAERERIHGDDNIALCFDTYGQASWAYVLNVNPYGIQSDQMWTPSQGEDGGFDIVWQSAATITDSGYQVEMAIPFSSLRFPNTDEQVWRVDFYRNRPRDVHQASSWAAYDRNESCWPCQWGTVTGIRGVQPGKGIELLPTVVGFQSGSLEGHGNPESPYDFVNEDPHGEFSFLGKYSVSSAATFEATYNPDFSQIEADAGQIDVNTTFALFYPERRPFFQEGSDIFRTLFNSFYTRTVNSPEFATKLTARTSKIAFGWMMARDEDSPITLPFEEFSSYVLADKSTTNVMRGRLSIGGGSQVGLIGTHRRFNGGGSGSVVSHDGLFRITRSLDLAYQGVISHTSEIDDTSMTSGLNNYVFWDNYTAGFDGESYWGHGGIARLQWLSRSVRTGITYWEVSPTYRADNGFDPKNNRRDLMAWSGYRFYTDSSGLFEWIHPRVNAGRVWNYDGEIKHQFVGAGVQSSMRFAQSFWRVDYTHWAENFRDTQFDDNWEVEGYTQLRFGDAFAFGGSYSYGHQVARNFLVKAKTHSADIWADFKPHDRILVEQWVDYLRGNHLDSGEELFDGYIYRTRVGYQILRPLSLRLVAQYNDFSETWDVDPLITYRINPFSMLYVGTTYRYTTCDEINLLGDISCTKRLSSRQFFMKLQYLFQL
jgi:hypothetical protein